MIPALIVVIVLESVVLFSFVQTIRYSIKELARLSIAAEGSRRRLADRRNATRYMQEGRRKEDRNDK